MKFCSILLMSFLWATTPALAQTVKTYDFSFGILGQRPDKTRFVSEETTLIPRRLKETGFRFGYTINERSGGTFIVQTIFTPPSRPKTVTGTLQQAGNSVVSAETTHQGTAAKSFSFSEGDPLGDWQLEVWLDGKADRVVKFRVIE